MSNPNEKPPLDKGNNNGNENGNFHSNAAGQKDESKSNTLTTRQGHPGH